MRIRKNAKVSPLLYLSHVAAPEDLQPHVCTVNQNPWEVRPLNQLEAEASSVIGFASGSFNSSVAAESVASMMDADAEEKTAEEEPEQNGVVEMGSNNSKQLEEAEEEDGDGDGNGNGNGEKTSPQLCIKNDGRGWHCKKLALLGQHYCPHHFSLSLHRSNNIRNPAAQNCIAPPKKSAPASAAVVVEGRARRVRARGKRGSAAANPQEMYFYSGFGPKWSQDRRVRNRDEQELAEDTINNAAPPLNLASTTSATTTSSLSGSRHTAPRSSSSPIRRDVEKLDYLDDDEDDEDDFDDVGSGGKRKRRPIKARSLKDL